jgi:uroporphyrinogen-III decarboxylase
MSSQMEKAYQERLNRYVTALNVGKPDKVPIRLQISEFSAKYAGFTLQEIYYDAEKNIAAATKLIQDFDMDTCPGAPNLWWAPLHDAVGAKYLKFAGRDLEENRQFQYVEEEYMKPEDYDAFIADPTKWIMDCLLPRIHEEFAEPGSFRANMALVKGAAAMVMDTGAKAQAAQMWREQYGYPTSIAGMHKAPFDTLGDVLRALRGIMIDLRKRPDKVLAALDVLVDHNIFYGMATNGGNTTLPNFLPLHRGAYPFLNEKQWDTFYWPTLKKVIEGLWEKGIRTMFYAEGNWTPYLEKIAELPDKSIVFHVDQTDIDKAHKILGGRFCISGNVPNTLLSYGKPEEVSDYCKRLIDNYAADGGFIMDAAGVIQYDAKVENIRALVETTREYGVY